MKYTSYFINSYILFPCYNHPLEQLILLNFEECVDISVVSARPRHVMQLLQNANSSLV